MAGRYDDDDDDSPFDRNGLLKDRRTARVSMMMRDGMTDVQRSVAADSDARRFGLRDAADLYAPGPRYCTDQAALDAKRRAYEDAKAEATTAWQRKPPPLAALAAVPPQTPVEDARPPIPVTDADFARQRRIKQAAYDAMVAADMCAWKGPGR